MMICPVWAILRKYELISFCSNAGSGCPKYQFARGVSALSEKVKLQAVRLGLWKADLELMGLHAVPANGKHCTERYSQGQLQVFYRGQPVFVLAVQVLVCLHHFCKEISLLREPGSIFMQVMCLQPVFNVHCFHLDLFLTCENEQ